MNTKRISEKFKRDVMLLLFEICTTLVDGNFSELSFGKVATFWKRFLLNFTEMMVRLSRSLLPQQVALKSVLNSTPRLYTVGSLLRSTSSGFKPDKYVPLIRISGLWLENYDFGIGDRFLVYPINGQLILKRPDSGCHESLKLGKRSDG